MAPRPTRIILVAAAMLILLAPGARAVSADLGHDAIADEIRAGEVKTPPGFGVLGALANHDQTLDLRSARAQDVSLQDATTLNAIALSRYSPVPFTVQEISDRETSRNRSSMLDRAYSVNLDTLNAALLMGLGGLHGTLEELMTRSSTFTTSDTLSQRASLSDENTFSGLAVLANHIPLDPHRLVDLSVVAKGGSATRDLMAQPDPKLVQTASIAPPLALGAATLMKSDAVVTPLTSLADETLQNSDSGSRTREVQLPDHVAFAAIALANNGGAVNGEDLLTIHETAHAARADTAVRDYPRENVLSALVLAAPVAVV